MPDAIASCGDRDVSRLPANQDLTFVRGPQAEDDLRQLGPAGADETGQAEDLAASDRQRHVSKA